MRTLIIATGLAALAAFPATAQTGGSRGTTANTGTAGISTTGTTTANTAGNTNATSSAFNVQTLPPSPGGAGTSGQTSSGTLAGNSSTGIVNTGEPVNTGAVGTLVPEGNVSVIGSGGTTGFSGSAVQQQAAPAAQTQTPLFDQAAREGLAKEQRRRARGEDPRIIGIAPRTDADLSWQMPDDKIIRY